MAEQKRYTVWVGQQTGVFDTRWEVQPLVSGVKGAKYKSFKSRDQALQALEQGREAYYQPQPKWYEQDLPFVSKSIAVDAACSSATGIMEYQGVDLQTQKSAFHASFPTGTNNIGEFLAILHAIFYLQKEQKSDYAIYSDSKIAINRIHQGKCKTNFPMTPENKELFDKIQKAEARLAANPPTCQILKRNTKEWWEIPADFGRK